MQLCFRLFYLFFLSEIEEEKQVDSAKKKISKLKCGRGGGWKEYVGGNNNIVMVMVAGCVLDLDACSASAGAEKGPVGPLNTRSLLLTNFVLIPVRTFLTRVESNAASPLLPLSCLQNRYSSWRS